MNVEAIKTEELDIFPAGPVMVTKPELPEDINLEAYIEVREILKYRGFYGALRKTAGEKIVRLIMENIIENGEWGLNLISETEDSPFRRLTEKEKELARTYVERQIFVEGVVPDKYEKKFSHPEVREKIDEFDEALKKSRKDLGQHPNGTTMLEMVLGGLTGGQKSADFFGF
jgi:hypothetical protein